MKLGLYQSPVSADKDENLRRAARGVRALAARGAELVLLPEMWCCPYRTDAFPVYAEAADGPLNGALSALARETGVWLAAGSVPEKDGGRVYNTAYVFAPDGGLAARHRKMHLFDIDVAGGQRFFESETLTAGDDITTFETPWGVFGLCVCYDLRFPELFRLMALRGARCVLTPAAFNMTTGPLHWDTLFRQRAADNQLFTVGCAPARDPAGPYVSYAHSMVASPWGRVLFRAGTRPQKALVELDFSETDAVRAQLPMLRQRRTDVYELREK